MRSKEKNILIGAVLIVVGLFIFFKNSSVYSFSFYRIGGVSTGGILIALLLLDVVLLVATSKRICKILLPVLIGMLVLSIILGTHIVYHGQVLDLLLTLIPAAAGAGLVIRGLLTKKD